MTDLDEGEDIPGEAAPDEKGTDAGFAYGESKDES